jgi:hypothetical protein
LLWPDDTLLAVQAPSGTQLEVPIPEMVCSISGKKWISYFKRDKCIFLSGTWTNWVWTLLSYCFLPNFISKSILILSDIWNLDVFITLVRLWKWPIIQFKIIWSQFFWKIIWLYLMKDLKEGIIIRLISLKNQLEWL